MPLAVFFLCVVCICFDLLLCLVLVSPCGRCSSAQCCSSGSSGCLLGSAHFAGSAGQDGQVVRWSRWSGDQVVRWSGGQVVRRLIPLLVDHFKCGIMQAFLAWKLVHRFPLLRSGLPLYAALLGPPILLETS